MEDFAGYEGEQIRTGGRNAYNNKQTADPKLAAIRDVQARLQEAELLRAKRQLRTADIRSHAGVETKLIISGAVGILGAMYASQTHGASALLAGALWLGGIWLLLSLTGLLWTVTKAGCITFWALGVPFIAVLAVTTEVIGPWTIRLAAAVGLILMGFQLIPVFLQGARAKGVIATFCVVAALLVIFSYHGEAARQYLAELMQQ